MDFDTQYHPAKVVIAREFFKALNRCAIDPQGGWLLSQCDIEGLVVRGSADCLLPGRAPFYTRSINDIDLRTFSSKSKYRQNDIGALIRFMRVAAEDAGFKFEHKMRRASGSFLRRAAHDFFFPRIDILITAPTGGNLSLAILPLSIETHVQLEGAVTKFSPINQPDFIKAENPYLRLAEKIRTLHNTYRVMQDPAIVRPSDSFGQNLMRQKVRRALDLMDAYQAHRVALDMSAGSRQHVELGIKNVFSDPFYSQFNRRTLLSIIHENWQNGLKYGGLVSFDQRESIATFMEGMVRNMESKGMLTFNQRFDYKEVVHAGHALMQLMPIPILNTLARVTRPMRQARRHKPKEPGA